MPRPKNSPLEDLVEGVYAEEIESGELEPVRPKGNGGGLPTIDPNDFTLRKELRTRYSKNLIKPEYYSKIDITDL